MNDEILQMIGRITVLKNQKEYDKLGRKTIKNIWRVKKNMVQRKPSKQLRTWTTNIRTFITLIAENEDNL